MNENIKFKAWDIQDKVMSDVLLVDFVHDMADLSEGKIEMSLSRLKLLQYMELEDCLGRRYCDDDYVLYKNEVYQLSKGDYAFELEGFYKPSQDNPSDFFSEGAYTDGEIVGNVYEGIWKKFSMEDLQSMTFINANGEIILTVDYSSSVEQFSTDGVYEIGKKGED